MAVASFYTNLSMRLLRGSATTEKYRANIDLYRVFSFSTVLCHFREHPTFLSTRLDKQMQNCCGKSAFMDFAVKSDFLSCCIAFEWGDIGMLGSVFSVTKYKYVIDSLYAMCRSLTGRASKCVNVISSLLYYVF